ncbi:MAG: hypothetical protein ACR2H5_16285 [Ktedonobacteraceae bacterium]
MNTAILTTSLGILGILGTAVLVSLAVRVMWFYRGSRQWSFRWHWRNWRMLQLSAIACFFFLAMAASYGVLGEVLAWVYLLAALKTGTWWLRCVINRRA